MKKYICLIFSVAAIVYSVIYASIGGFVGNAGALSKIGLSHPVLFFIWGMLTFAALSINVIVGFQKTKYKFYILLLSIAFVGMMLTLLFDFDYDQYNGYLAHCIGSMTFSIVMGITVFLLFLLSKRYVLSVITGCILIADLILLIIFKETAIIELMPIFSGYVLMTMHNFRKEKNPVENKR